jgi:hypothetical protein
MSHTPVVTATIWGEITPAKPALSPPPPDQSLGAILALPDRGLAPSQKTKKDVQTTT